MITIDANALVKLVIDEDKSDEVERVIFKALTKDEPVVAPNIALYETMNVLWKYYTGKKKLARDKVMLAFERLLQIWEQVKHVDNDDLRTLAMTIALDSGLTAYDSLYAATSILYKSPLLTFDKDIKAKAEEIGITLVE
jgi:predicted nucleic acid-binding protein